MQKFLITAGLVILAVGILWPLIGKLPLGRLPGDIVINRPGLRIYFPIATMVIVSFVITLILKFLGK